MFSVQTFRSDEETGTWVVAPRQSGLVDSRTRLSWKLFSQEERSTLRLVLRCRGGGRRGVIEGGESQGVIEREEGVRERQLPLGFFGFFRPILGEREDGGEDECGHWGCTQGDRLEVASRGGELRGGR